MPTQGEGGSGSGAVGMGSILMNGAGARPRSLRRATPRLNPCPPGAAKPQLTTRHGAAP